MKTLVFGAGPIGSVYTHLLSQAGKDVTILARGQRYDFIKANGLVLVDEVSGSKSVSKVQIVNQLTSDCKYDLVIVLVRKNKLCLVIETLRSNENIKNILFMGNNALGFENYLKHLPREKVLFGFPGAGGGISEQIVHYADREKEGSKRIGITIGEVDGETKERTINVKKLFETSGIPVDLVEDIDWWLKYHIALVLPLGNALYKHNCDSIALSKDKKTLRMMVRAAKEGGRVLEALGYTKRYPWRFNLFYWLPEILNVMAVQKLLESKFAEVAFAMHASAAGDEMSELSEEFQSLVDKTTVKTPNIDALKRYINGEGKA
ncbi:MAG: hypothetical protein DHS20C13_03230 [Thermodesulfobacteriota bacterium]|nr:MAG: hypothetical protein DHS20C13_03230 [Thermodesulfobacteriota bacterium]